MATCVRVIVPWVRGAGEGAPAKPAHVSKPLAPTLMPTPASRIDLSLTFNHSPLHSLKQSGFDAQECRESAGSLYHASRGIRAQYIGRGIAWPGSMSVKASVPPVHGGGRRGGAVREACTSAEGVTSASSVVCLTCIFLKIISELKERWGREHGVVKLVICF